MGHVVIADQVSVRDPKDNATRREEMHWLYVSRGEMLPDDVSSDELKRLQDLGAVVEEGSEHAKAALSGGPRLDSLRTPPSGIPLLRNESEAIRATQAAAQQPGGAGAGGGQAATELVKLPLENLRVMAKAFGVKVDEKATKLDLAEALAHLGRNAPEAESADERDERVQARDERQVAARESGNEAGLVGSDVTASGARGSDARDSAAARQAKASEKSSGAKSDQK
jgi:hypothetical protein